VLRIEPRKEDGAATAILELVDGPKDMRFAMTAMTLARERAAGEEMRDITAMNVKKVTQFRQGGEEALEKAVREMEARASMLDRDGVAASKRLERRKQADTKESVYPKYRKLG